MQYKKIGKNLNVMTTFGAETRFPAIQRGCWIGVCYIRNQNCLDFFFFFFFWELESLGTSLLSSYNYDFCRVQINTLSHILSLQAPLHGAKLFMLLFGCRGQRQELQRPHVQRETATFCPTALRALAKPINRVLCNTSRAFKFIFLTSIKFTYM